MKNEKVVKHFTSEEIREMHGKSMRELMHRFLKADDNTWPELKTWDYRERYSMPIEGWHQKYDISRKFNTYGVESLFMTAAMMGAPRKDLVQIMKFLLVLVDYVEFQLDEDKARIELGIPLLRKKYTKEMPHA